MMPLILWKCNLGKPQYNTEYLSTNYQWHLFTLLRKQSGTFCAFLFFWGVRFGVGLIHHSFRGKFSCNRDQQKPAASFRWKANTCIWLATSSCLCREQTLTTNRIGTHYPLTNQKLEGAGLDWTPLAKKKQRAASALFVHYWRSPQYADWHKTCSRARCVPKPVFVCVQARRCSALARPSTRWTSARWSGRAARFCPMRTGEPSERIRVHRGWQHQADVLRLWPQRNGAKRWDRHEVWKVCMVYLKNK